MLSLAWCNEDPDLIVSCGKDNKLIFWDANGEGEVLGPESFEDTVRISYQLKMI